MDYLKKYGINEIEIEQIKQMINERKIDIDQFTLGSDKVIKILDIFVRLGINNIYDIIMINPYMFFETIDSIKDRIDSYDNKEELSKLINEDASNLSLVSLL